MWSIQLCGVNPLNAKAIAFPRNLTPHKFVPLRQRGGASDFLPIPRRRKDTHWEKIVVICGLPLIRNEELR